MYINLLYYSALETTIATTSFDSLYEENVAVKQINSFKGEQRKVE